MPRIFLLVLLFTLPAFAADPSVHVIAYHDVRDDVIGDYDSDQYAVSTKNLIQQFTWLRDNDFHPVSIDDLLAARDGNAALPENAVLLTFDDGLVSFYTKVYPLLKLFNYPAVISVVTDWIETDATVPYADRKLTGVDFLTWEQLREMQASGLVEVASHSHDLHRGILGNPQGNQQPAAVTRRFEDGRYESTTAYLSRIEDDLSQSIAAIDAETGRKPRVITWPYGAFNDLSAAVAAKLGMRLSLTLSPKDLLRDDTWHFGRYLVVSNPTLGYFSEELLFDQPEAIVRVAQVDLDYVYDSDPAQQNANLDRLLDRIKALEISHVYLQAFADTDADGGAAAVYFPNRHLPVRADLFNRVAWQLKTRADVRVYAWLPLLSFVGGPFDSHSRVMQYRDNELTPDPNSEPRLSPFSAEVRELIGEVYEDLAIHSRIDGILFHDDGRLNEFEDFSQAAQDVYRDALGIDVAPDLLLADSVLQKRWSDLKARTLVDFSKELIERVRIHHPELKSARNIFASALLDRESVHYLAQDFDDFLATYDHVALMAMPGVEQAEEERQFYEDLVKAVSERSGGFERTIFELQTMDWAASRSVESRKIRQTMRWLQSLGVRHLGYYPDDFIKGHPDLEDLRLGMSLADSYGEVLP